MVTSHVASAPASRFWTERGPLNWARVLPTYWEAGAQPHRQTLIRVLKEMPPFESARELGCCAGTNIKLIRDAFPHAVVQGVEISQEATIFAQNKFLRDGQVAILCADMLDEGPLWKPAEVDLVVSCYSLAYIAPEDLPSLMEDIVRSANMGILLVEPMIGEAGRLQVQGGTIEWRHNYTMILDRILSQDKRNAKLENAALPEKVEHCDGMVKVTFLD